MPQQARAVTQVNGIGPTFALILQFVETSAHWGSGTVRRNGRNTRRWHTSYKEGDSIQARLLASASTLRKDNEIEMTKTTTARRALIIGAGPAGLTAAYELLTRTDIVPIVLEKSEYMGGISRTVNYKGNRIDIGGHRFFSKSDRVMNWWLNVMPLEARGNGAANGSTSISYQNKSRDVATSASGPSPESTDRVMLIRHRKSRIYFLRRFFDYPIKLSKETLAKLGMLRTVKIGVSYTRAVASQIKPEKSLEDFLTNRFGRE